MTSTQAKTAQNLGKTQSNLEISNNKQELFEYTIESSQDRKALKENLMFLIEQKQKKVS